ncbi:MAG: hypothetical protein ACFFFH_04210 [Candidatus Thorarchaeota archaeon]
MALSLTLGYFTYIQNINIFSGKLISEPIVSNITLHVKKFLNYHGNLELFLLKLAILTQQEQESIHAAALNVLETTGCEIQDPNS